MLCLGSLDRVILQVLRLKLEKEGNSPKENYLSAPSATLPVSIRGKLRESSREQESAALAMHRLSADPQGCPASEGYQQLLITLRGAKDP